MIKVKDILIGWWNYLFPNPRIEEMAARRLRHCYGHQYKEGDNVVITTPRCKENNNGVCGLCLCPLKSKTRAPEQECPILKWPAE